MAFKMQQYENLLIQLDQEAEQSKLHLKQIEQDIKEKHDVHCNSIERVQERVREQIEHQNQTYDHYMTVQEEMQNSRSAKVVQKHELTMKKLKRVNQDNLNKTMDLNCHNEERFSRRNQEYDEVLKQKRQTDVNTITRAKNKNSIMEDLMIEKDIELSKKVEKNRLMVVDAVQQLTIERKRKQEF